MRRLRRSGVGDARRRISTSNHETVTLAVYLLGGERKNVDTEDVAIKVNEIAPGRFTWRKYADQVNLEIVRVYLSDAKKPGKGGYLVGSGTDGWHLTEAGLHFARSRVGDTDALGRSRKSLTSKEEQRRRHERSRLLTSEVFEKFRIGGAALITPREAEAFFRLDEYVVGDARERKIVHLVSIFGDDPDLGDIVRELARKIRRQV